MNEFLQSLRADLLSRRMLPLLALAVIGLAVAVGYALASSSSSAPPRASGPPAASAPPASLAVAAASPNPNGAVAETPGGVRYQTQGPLHDPFAQLPSSQTKGPTAGSSSVSPTKSSAAAGAGASPSGTGSSGAGSGSGAGGSGNAKGGEPSPPPTPGKQPGKHKQKPSYPYDVSILFGELPADGQPVTLPPYQSLQPQRPIPSAQDALIALERVGGNAKSAVFELLQPPILRGQGVCLPSPSECQQLALDAGQAEELEYLETDGQAVVYELKAVSIVKRSSQTAG